MRKNSLLLLNVSLFLLLFGVVTVEHADAQSGTVRSSEAVSDDVGSDRPVKIIEKPEPVLGNEVRAELMAAGTKTLRVEVEFLDLGLIGAINPVDSQLPEGATEALLAAAEKIKFQPEVRDGKYRTSRMIVEYTLMPPAPPKLSPVSAESSEKAQAVIKRAIKALGGERYINVRSQVGRGAYTLLGKGRIISYQTFVDVIVYPDMERTDLRESGIQRSISNANGSGWIFDDSVETIEDQTSRQLEGFQRAMRTNPDNLLRGKWDGKAAIAFVERRSASPGRRNDVISATFGDGFKVEFEFSDKGFPAKVLYSREGSDGREISEEVRFARYIDVQGVKTPFVIDRFTGGQHSSRINYESVKYNAQIPPAVFEKPGSLKQARKKLKL